MKLLIAQWERQGDGRWDGVAQGCGGAAGGMDGQEQGDAYMVRSLETCVMVLMKGGRRMVLLIMQKEKVNFTNSVQFLIKVRPRVNQALCQDQN